MRSDLDEVRENVCFDMYLENGGISTLFQKFFYHVYLPLGLLWHGDNIRSFISARIGENQPLV